MLIIFLGLTQIGLGQIISQYFETNSGTTPKGIEIWNNTASTLDFSSNNLIIKKGVNGGLPNTDFTLSSGTLVSNAVIVVGTSDMEAEALANGAVFHLKPFTFNGDDALEIWYGSTKTDVFGNPGLDPGTNWSGSGVATSDQNISLKAGIQTGDLVGWTDPSTRFETTATDNSLTGFGIAPAGDGSLPVSLSSFTATSFHGDVRLNWSTDSEIENAGFIIEKSILRQAEGDSDFETIASFKTHRECVGQGSTTAAHDYAFVDATVSNGLTYEYRLSDVDYAGKITIHDAIIVSVKSDESIKPNTFEITKLYPNPFNPSIQIEVAFNEKIEDLNISIYDINGALMKVLEIGNMEQELLNLKWDGTNFNNEPVPSGVYIVDIASQNIHHAKRVTLLR